MDAFWKKIKLLRWYPHPSCKAFLLVDRVILTNQVFHGKQLSNQTWFARLIIVNSCKVNTNWPESCGISAQIAPYPNRSHRSDLGRQNNLMPTQIAPTFEEQFGYQRHGAYPNSSHLKRRGCTKRCFLVPAKPIHILCVISFRYCLFNIEISALTGLRFGTFGALRWFRQGHKKQTWRHK